MLHPNSFDYIEELLDDEFDTDSELQGISEDGSEVKKNE